MTASTLPTGCHCGDGHIVHHGHRPGCPGPVRRLPYRQHPVMPLDRQTVVEWCVEVLLSSAHDSDAPELVAVVCRLNPDVAAEIVAREIDLLYVLSSQVDEAGRYAAADDDWQAPRALCVSEYEDHLRRVARLVRGGGA